MGALSFYLFAKVYLDYIGVINLNILLNLLFAFFLVFPLPKKLRANKPIRKLKVVTGILLATALMWHDSWLPSPYDIFLILKRDGLPTNGYIYSFLIDYYDPYFLLAGGGALLLCVLVSRYIKLVNIAIIVLLVLIPYRAAGQTNELTLDKYLDDFFDSEEIRVSYFKKKENQSPDFDIIMLHICSLAWDDLSFIGLRNHPFFKKFNFLFTNFNSVTGYSGPAMIRLLNANCGQMRHSNIYDNTPKECHLLSTFADAGFNVSALLNHNGEYGHFIDQIRKYSYMNLPVLTYPNLPFELRMFDNSPVYDDYSVLNEWWKLRQKGGEGSAALYYNTVTLHDGVHEKNDKKWWNMDRKWFYTKSIRKLMSDIDKFFAQIEASGRKAVVVFVSEHGMALRGTPIQKSRLRDIPLSRITAVPLGIRLIGGKYNERQFKQQVITKPTSYLAISYLLSNFVDKSPFESEKYTTRRFLDTLPLTDFVAENDTSTSIKFNNKQFFRQKNKSWLELTENM